MHGAIKISLGVFVGILVVIFIALISSAVKDVKNEEMALKYHTVSREFDRQQVPLEQGRYVVHPGEKLFKFKRVYTLESFEGDNAVNCVSKDGLSLHLDITFQYKIRPSDLVTMFSLLGFGYEDVIRLEAKSAIRDACGNWTSVDFYYRRQDVQTDMGDRVDKKLDSIYCDGGFLQLVNVGFDTLFSRAVQDTQSAIQDISQAENERQQILIQAQTQVLAAQKSADIILTNARASAEAILVVARAEARSINATISSQKEAYLNIVNTLGLTGKDLINYIAVQTLQNSHDVTMNVKSPAKFGFQ